VRVEDQAQEIERLGATAQKILNNVNHELRLPVGNVMNFAQMLSEGLEKYSTEHLKMLLDEVLQNSNRLSSMILNMLDLAMLEAKKIELKKQTINFSEMIYERIKNCSAIYLQEKPIDFEMNIEPEIFIFVDPNYIRQTIDNLLINAITYSNDGTIKIDLYRTNENTVEIIIKDQGIGIPKNELYDIFTPFKMSSKTEYKAQGRGVGLALCKAAIEAHGGHIKVESDGVIGARFTVSLPLRKI
jgi:signal transduction histidine kinase